MDCYEGGGGRLDSSQMGFFLYVKFFLEDLKGGKSFFFVHLGFSEFSKDRIYSLEGLIDFFTNFGTS